MGKGAFWYVIMLCGLQTLAMIGGTVWIHAYMNGGSVTVYVNNLSEALPELVLLLFFCFSCFMAFAVSARRELFGDKA